MAGLTDPISDVAATVTPALLAWLVMEIRTLRSRVDEILVLAQFPKKRTTR